MHGQVAERTICCSRPCDSLNTPSRPPKLYVIVHIVRELGDRTISGRNVGGRRVSHVLRAGERCNEGRDPGPGHPRGQADEGLFHPELPTPGELAATVKGVP